MKPVLKDPAPRYVGKYPWEEIVKPVKEQPGKWFLVAEQIPHSTAAAVMRGKISWVPPEDFEIRTDNTTFAEEGLNRRRCDLYLKYIAKKGKK